MVGGFQGKDGEELTGKNVGLIGIENQMTGLGIRMEELRPSPINSREDSSFVSSDAMEDSVGQPSSFPPDPPSLQGLPREFQFSMHAMALGSSRAPELIPFVSPIRLFSPLSSSSTRFNSTPSTNKTTFETGTQTSIVFKTNPSTQQWLLFLYSSSISTTFTFPKFNFFSNHTESKFHFFPSFSTLIQDQLQSNYAFTFRYSFHSYLQFK